MTQPSAISAIQQMLPLPTVMAGELGERKKQPSAIPLSEKGNRIGPRQLRSRERSGGSDPEAAPPHTQNAKFLNLILDL